MNDLAYLVALTHFGKFGARRLQQLRRHFNLWKSVFEASEQELCATGLFPALAQEFTAARPRLDPEKLWPGLEAENIKILPLEAGNFPPLLASIYDPPLALYYKGALPPRDSICIAVVGSRAMSPYGRQVTWEMTRELAQSGAVIVSGLALGIDSAAHEAALEAGGATVAVLGGGIDRASVSPGRHRHLAERIAASGSLVCSEYPPGAPALAHQFPERNRIIAGFSTAVLVVEAKEHSGALITAKLALEEGREVFAVPGPVTQETSAGTNWLIKQGAAPATSAADILETLEIKTVLQKSLQPSLSQTEAIIYDMLTREPQHIDKLAAHSKLDISALASTLSLMEMKGLVRNMGGMQFVRAM